MRSLQSGHGMRARLHWLGKELVICTQIQYVYRCLKVAVTDSWESRPSLTVPLKCSSDPPKTMWANPGFCGGIQVQAQSFCEICIFVIKFTFSSVAYWCFVFNIKTVLSMTIKGHWRSGAGTSFFVLWFSTRPRAPLFSKAIHIHVPKLLPGGRDPCLK